MTSVRDGADDQISGVVAISIICISHFIGQQPFSGSSLGSVEFISNFKIRDSFEVGVEVINQILLLPVCKHWL